MEYGGTQAPSTHTLHRGGSFCSELGVGSRGCWIGTPSTGRRWMNEDFHSWTRERERNGVPQHSYDNRAHNHNRKGCTMFDQVHFMHSTDDNRSSQQKKKQMST